MRVSKTCEVRIYSFTNDPLELYRARAAVRALSSCAAGTSDRRRIFDLGDDAGRVV